MAEDDKPLLAGGGVGGASQGAGGGFPQTEDQSLDSGPLIGASDAEADAANSGADVDPKYDAARDSDGVPTGAADADEDARRSGADSR